MSKMYDSAMGTIPALPNGGAGVDLLIPTDGQWFANGQKMKQANPNARVHTISEIGAVVADWIDCEPGCVWPPETAVNLWRTWRNQGCKGFYSSQSTQPTLRSLLAPGETPEWFDADPGPDKVDPGDAATQYDFEGPFDVSETTPQFEGVAPPQPLPDKPAQEENMILRDPQTGGVWVVESATGAIFAYDGAPFLGGTNNTGVNPGSYTCVGICEFHDSSGVGYELVLDWGDRGDGHSQDGGDRYRRYKFPRSGSAKSA